jgi:hypothetical protein
LRSVGVLPIGGRTLQALSADIACLEKKRSVAQGKEAESGNPEAC